MSLIRVVPSVTLAWLVYHGVALAYGASFEADPLAVLYQIVVSIPMLNQGTWQINVGDIIAMLTVITAFIEVLKAADFARIRILDHLLVSVMFTLALIEFLTLRAMQTSTFFLIVLALFLDVTVGYYVGLRVARRDLAIEQVSA